jgi:magnesium chelatase accessory protein
MIDADRPNWAHDGRDWPHRQSSQFVHAGGVRWHVQRFGQGPAALLVHGTGASSHSWCRFAELLAQRFSLVIPDLPDHGFSEAPANYRLSLPAMSDGLQKLLKALDVSPVLAVGHSAGAAVLASSCLKGGLRPRLLISVNGAWLPFRGIAGQIFPSIAKLLSLNPFASRLFAWSIDRSTVLRLVGETGSKIDGRGLELYERLLQRPGHVAGALGMMANWDLEPLVRQLAQLELPVILLAGSKDRSIPPQESRRVAAMLPNARVEILEGLGHLAHEERPNEIAALVLRLAAGSGIIE